MCHCKINFSLHLTRIRLCWGRGGNGDADDDDDDDDDGVITKHPIAHLLF